MDVLVPDWAILRQVVNVAEYELLVASPYYSTEGLNHLMDTVRAEALTFLTRLSPPDWAAGAADPPALALALMEAQGRGSVVRLGVAQRLHAKAYVADDTLALVGSANLTANGFGGNVELAVRLEGAAAAQARRTLLDAVAPSVRWLDVGRLTAWAEASEAAVLAARQRAAEEDIAEELASTQAELDTLLGYGGGGVTGLPDPDRGDLDAFIAWLERKRELAGAQVVIERHYNRDGNHLTGHVRQSFSAAVRFFTEHPDLQRNLSAQLSALGPDDIYQLDPPPVQEAWFRHLDEHATDEGPIYSYPTLRGILPPSAGGTREGGGGGASTLKRMLPLVARYRETTG